ncbi:ABC transporter substrate-binding protein [Ornithinimicrobium cavernae]|uniref:ABC transporter substrate-binding protein n=1 Tax=Ornithinimicrobium cavernae TaxID=2666047 RepID=UPI00137B0B35|nr:ABC transporter substrate-binding protein [Ornithinimicrobium cavernae]
MNLKMRTVVGIASAGIVLTACGGPAAEEAADQAADQGAEGGNKAVSVAAVSTSCLQFYPMYVALEEGIFEENGLDVTIERMNGSGAVLQAMLAGQVDIGTPGPVPTILAQAQGEDIKYVANLWPGGAFALVATEASGITDAADLRGKTIGVATADGSEVSFAQTILGAEGMEEGDYEILVVGEGGQAVAGFQREDIDAYAASMDGVATIEHAGIPLTDITGDSTSYLFGNGLAADASYIEENPDVIGAFGKSFREGRELADEDEQAVIDACQVHQPQEVEDLEYVSAHLGALSPSFHPGETEWGSMTEEAWEQIIADTVQTGDIAEGEIEAKDLFTNEFVEAFNQ